MAVPPVKTQEIARYIADMSVGLIGMASTQELRYLGYLLRIVEAEARAQAQEQLPPLGET